MLELLLLVCMKDDPTACEQRSLTIAERRMSPMACAMAAPPQIARYMARFPEREVARWKCGPAGTTRFAGGRAGEPI